MDSGNTLQPVFPNLRELEIFALVCELGSISAASERAGISQSAVSQLLKRLETQMGSPLLDRGKRPIKPTAHGNVVLGRSARLLKESRLFVAAFQSSAEARKLDLRIGFVETMSRIFTKRLIENFGSRLDQLYVMIGSTEQQCNLFLERKLDIIVVGEQLNHRQDLEAHLLVDEPFVLLLPSDVSVGNIEDMHTVAATVPMVKFSQKSSARSYIDAQMKRLKIDVRRSYDIDSADIVVELVNAGLGWTMITPLLMLRAASFDGDAHMAPFPGPAFRRRLYLVARSGELGDFPATLARLMREILREDYLPNLWKREPWLRSGMKTAV